LHTITDQVRALVYEGSPSLLHSFTFGLKAQVYHKSFPPWTSGCSVDYLHRLEGSPDRNQDDGTSGQLTGNGDW